MKPAADDQTERCCPLLVNSKLTGYEQMYYLYLEVQCQASLMRPVGGHRHQADAFPHLIFQALQRPEHRVRRVAARRPHRDLHRANLPALISLRRRYLDLDLLTGLGLVFLGAGVTGGALGQLRLESFVLLLEVGDLGPERVQVLSRNDQYRRLVLLTKLSIVD
jgi:hypothetical protein